MIKIRLQVYLSRDVISFATTEEQIWAKELPEMEKIALSLGGCDGFEKKTLLVCRQVVKLVFDRLWISGSVGITSSNLYCHF